MTWRLLDLFSGAGGAAYGYMQAGFHVTGVDLHPQPRYKGDVFIQGDALDYLAAHGQEYDVVHASPPCQAYSKCTPMAYRAHHPRLIEAVREGLERNQKPYVIENVENARRYLRNAFFLCGSMFALPIWRHRYFETTGFPFPLTVACNHSVFPVLISGTFRRKGVKRRDYTVTERRSAIGINWMIDRELDEAIPPAYTRWIGEKLLTRLETLHAS
jgi:DNA (cytosine-5)-methyltransferase 1